MTTRHYLEGMFRDLKRAENPDELTLAIACRIDAANMSLTPGSYGTDAEGFRCTMGWGAQQSAIVKALDIIEMIQPAGTVRMPRSVDEARAMNLVSERYLRDNDPQWKGSPG